MIKKHLTLFLLLLVCCVQSAKATYATVDGLTYSLKSGWNTAEVIFETTYESFTGNVVIPESIVVDGKKYDVTSLGDGCFSFCRLTSITIPKSVTSLGRNCFCICKSLTSITIPESVTSLSELCFFGCSSLTSITIPKSVTSLGDKCFSDCSSLTNITIPKSVTSLGKQCFYGCSSLTSITIPESVTSLSDYCFLGCSSLTSITIPKSVTSLGAYCFQDCSSLTSITIPKSVTSLGDYCFSLCSSLTSITIPESVTSLGGACFWKCSSLTSITIPKSVTSLGGICFLGCSSLTSISIPESVTFLSEGCFQDCSSLTSITIPKSITSIDRWCFYGCSSLTDIISLAPTPPIISSDTIYNYLKETDIYVKSGSLNLYKKANGWKDFPNIYALVDSISFAEKSVFLGLGKSYKVEYAIAPSDRTNAKLIWESSDEEVVEVDQNGVLTAKSFGIADVTVKATDGSGVTASLNVAVYNSLYEYNKETLRATLLPNDYSGNISIPEKTMMGLVEYTVDSIAPGCFKGAALDTLIIPATVQKYGADAFKDASIKNWTYNGTIGNWCASHFANAAANPIQATETKALVLDNVEIKSVVVPSSIKELLPYTFFGCASIDTVEVNSFVTAIGDSCFASCDIKQFTVKATTVPTLGKDALAANIGTAIVPQDYYGDYYTADGWKELSNIISSTDKKTYSYFVTDKSLYHLNKETGETSICNPVDAISQTAEYKGTIVLPTAVEYNHKTYPLTAIGPSCFKDNTAVDSIALPATLKAIEASAFSGCKGLGANFLGSLSQWCAIKFDDGTANPMSIKGRLMIGGKEVTDLSIPSDVKNIADYAFYKCANLTRAEIGEQVESVGSSSFAGCTGITDLKLLCVCEVAGGSFVSCPLVRIQSGNEKFWQSIGSNFASTLETAIITDDYTGMCPMFNGYIKLRNITLSNKITAITSFEGCTSLTEFTIPEEVLTISENAFKNCPNLKTLNIPGNYDMSIDDNAFVNCTGLETINYGGDIVDWCSLVFSNKYSNPIYYAQSVLIQGEPLTTLDVPDGSGAKYRDYAFVNLKSLKKVVISAITGGLSTFSGCSNLEEIHLTGPQTAEVLMPAFKGEFDGVDKTTCKLYVPSDLVSKYQQAYIWKDFLNILPLADTPEETTIQSITFTTQPHDMTVGETQTLYVEIAPDNADNKTLAWSSSDTSVATVSASGMVSALAPGAVTITVAATDGSGVTASCTLAINAKAQPVTAIQLSQQTATLTQGETLQLSATVTPDNASNKTLTWSSSDESVATVSDDGIVQALAVGEAIVTATATDGSNVSANCVVTVKSSDTDPTDEKVTDIECLVPGTAIKIYPYGMGGEADAALSCDKDDEYARLGSVELCGEEGSVWTLEDAGDGYFYIRNINGRYWTNKHLKSSILTMTLASNKADAVKVKLVWNSYYSGVSFLNVQDNLYLSNIHMENLNNWYDGGYDPLTYNTKSTYDVYVVRSNRDSLYFDASEVSIDKDGSTVLYLTCLSSESSVYFSSSNEKVATISMQSVDGNIHAVTVKGKAAGTATITARAGDLSASCVVNVTETSGIAGISSKAADGSAYYTLDGIKLNGKPQLDGVYIRVKDGKSQKIVIKNK